MFEFFKSHKVAFLVTLVLIVLAPIIINGIVMYPAYNPNWVAGEKQSVWINFFAVYSSTLIGAFVSFSILYKTIKVNETENENNRKDNHAENEDNRKRLEVLSIYQTEKDDFQIAKESVVRFDLAVNCFELGFIPMYSKLNKEDALFRLKKMSKELSNAYSQMEFYLNDYDNEIEKDYKEYFKNFIYEEDVLIGDILWILDYWTYQGSDELNRDLFIKKTEEYKHIAKDTKFKRIWHYVEAHGYNIIADGENIINERLDDFDFITIHQKLLEFCSYEKERINSILTKNC